MNQENKTTDKTFQNYLEEYAYQQKRREKHIKEKSVTNVVSEFLGGICEQANTSAISTGFSELDGVLEGGLYEGLYIVGAVSSLGKTTFVLQIADQIAQQGEDVLIFSLEMSQYELIAKSISRLTYLNCNGKTEHAKTNRGITVGARWEYYSEEELGLLTKSISHYKTYSDHLYIQEGIGEIGVEQIKEVVREHIFNTGKKPVIIIDYLQIVAPHDLRASDKQNTDKAILELKRLSRDYKIPVIGISSLNRQNYNTPINMAAFKESGSLEYSSDVLIGLQLMGAGSQDFDVNTAKSENPRKIEAVILKNRNGSTGGKLFYDYHAMFNYFLEKSTKTVESLKTTPPDKDGFQSVLEDTCFGKSNKKR